MPTSPHRHGTATAASARADARAATVGRGKPSLQSVAVAAALAMAFLVIGLSWSIGGAFRQVLDVAEEAQTAIIPRINRQQEYAVVAARLGQLAEAVLSARSSESRQRALGEVETLAGRFATDIDPALLTRLNLAVHAVRRTAERADLLDTLGGGIAATRDRADAVFLRVLGSGTALAAQEPFFRMLEVLGEAAAAPDQPRLEVLEERFRTLAATVRIALATSEGAEIEALFRDIDALTDLYVRRREMLVNEAEMALETDKAHALLRELTESLRADAASGTDRIAELLIDNGRNGILVVSVGLGAAAAVQLALFILLRTHVVRPIRLASEALAEVQRARRVVRLPPARFAEIDAITSGVERFGEALVDAHEYADALKAGEARLRTILSASPFPVVIARVSDGSVLFFNRQAEARFGVDGARLTLTRDARFFADPADAHRLMRRLEEEGAVGDLEMRLLTAQGRPFWALLSAVEMRDGDEPAFLVAINDITQQKRSEQEAHAAKQRAEQALSDLRHAQETLIQSEKMASLGALVAGVAHEVNTPVGVALTGITHLADATRQFRGRIAEGAVRRTDLAEYMDTAAEVCALIETNLHRAGELIQSFKQTAVDQTSEERRAFDLKDYLDDVLTSLHPRLKKMQHGVGVQCPEGLIVDGYPGALFQVLTNLTMNALTHAFPDGQAGRIDLSVTRCGADEVELRFTDDGCGIPDANRLRIFDPFFTTKRGAGGSGLGLHIVYNIVTKRLRGTIRVESEEGKGTTFILRFPLRMAPAAGADRQDAAPVA
ncbi:PAS domain-containing sensor histidine kinase [Azospirillum halopraeferens]|uniref:PAS domain-containing sensor histidine kinase n=1 Tax=Azospirillum halopraeferens TaxID=34010 RepID=UPI0003FD186E|nr:PAS domain-containing sensor histidine kinase [Azospirillum halopraeferens]